MNESNEGIIVSGGSISASQISVGSYSHVIYNAYNVASELEAIDQKEVAKAIIDLLGALESKGKEIQNSEEVVDVVQRVAEEVGKDNPSKLTLKSLLNSISEAVTPVANILEKVSVLKTAIAAMMGWTAL